MNKHSQKKIALLTAVALSLNLLPILAMTTFLGSTQVHAMMFHNVQSEDDLLRALNSATPGDTIQLEKGFTVTNGLVINKAITIDGNGNTINSREGTVMTTTDVTLRNINFAGITENRVPGKVIATAGTLTLDGVTTLVNANQSDQRPSLIVRGAGNILVKNAKSETVFHSIIDEDATPSSIQLESRSIRVTNGVQLQSGTMVVSRSNFVSQFSGNGSVEFKGTTTLSGVTLSNVSNVILSEGAYVSLAENLANTAVTGKIDLQVNTTLNAGSNQLSIAELTGNGTYQMQADAQITAKKISSPVTVAIQHVSRDYTQFANHAYVIATEVVSEPVITLNPEPSTLKLKKEVVDKTSWMLIKKEKIDKSNLHFYFLQVGYDRKKRIFTPIKEYTEASAYRKDQLNKALAKAKVVDAKLNPTQAEVDEAALVLEKAYIHLSEPDPVLPQTTISQLTTTSFTTSRADTTTSTISRSTTLTSTIVVKPSTTVATKPSTASTTKSSTQATTITKVTTTSKSTTKMPTTKRTTKATTKNTTKPSVKTEAVYRLYHAGIKRHLYTKSAYEAKALSSRGWNFEGEKFRTVSQGTSPVYRLYHSGTREHLYTTSTNERDTLKTRSWRYEGIAWYSTGKKPIYRLYHAGLKVHLYTADANEKNTLSKRGWKYEGISFYVN